MFKFQVKKLIKNAFEMNMRDMLIDGVLSRSLQDSFRSFYLFGEEKAEEVKVVEKDDYVEPPEEITLEKLKELTDESGAISLVFTDNKNPQFEERMDFSTSYYTVSQKERLLLLFAENFRRQFKEKYPHRRPLVLAPFNECNIQKFVSTTIKPTTFVNFPDLIDSWENCASFIADHIVYEPLEKPTSIVSKTCFSYFYFKILLDQKKIIFLDFFTMRKTIQKVIFAKNCLELSWFSNSKTTSGFFFNCRKLRQNLLRVFLGFSRNVQERVFQCLN